MLAIGPQRMAENQNDTESVKQDMTRSVDTSTQKRRGSWPGAERGDPNHSFADAPKKSGREDETGSGWKGQSYAEFNKHWSEHVSHKRLSNLLQDLHVSFIANGLNVSSAFTSIAGREEALVVIEEESEEQEFERIDFSTFDRGLRSFEVEGIGVEEIQLMFEAMDRDGDGILSSRDWQSCFEEADDVVRLEYLSWIKDIFLEHFPSVADGFRAFDTDGDGLITPHEFAMALDSLEPSISMDEMGKILWSLDVSLDHDGMQGAECIYFQEFMHRFHFHGLLDH